MPILTPDKERSPENISALMTKFRELIIQLENDGEETRKKLEELRQRAQYSQIRLRAQHLDHLDQTHQTHKTRQSQHHPHYRHSAFLEPTTISTSTIPTDSTPSTSDVADFPLRRAHRSATLPAAGQSSPPPPVRPPRQSDILRRDLENIYRRCVKQQEERERRHSQFKRRSSTMASGAIKGRGALIVLEGVDRVGKSTLSKKLVDHLEKLRCSVTHCRFPDRTTPVGHLIDDYLKSSSKQVEDHVQHLLFSANRWELSKRIRSTLNQGTSVVVDRYAYSGIAYSSAKPGLTMKWCCETERGLPRPDLVIYLELRGELQHQRDGFGDERLETKEIQDLVRLKYEQVMDASKETWLKVDVEGKSPDQVLAEVILPVKRCLESAAIKELGALDFFEISN